MNIGTLIKQRRKAKRPTQDAEAMIIPAFSEASSNKVYTTQGNRMQITSTGFFITVLVDVLAITVLVAG